jgi:DNA-binding transcriptional LysR family regulator
VDLVSLLTTFVRIADSGSISSAARTLRLSVPMASRHLRALEQDLGAALVRRTTRRLDLTEAGAELLPRARRLLREMDEARNAVRPTKDAGGLLVISAPVSFGLAQIAPLLPKLLEQNPKLSIEVRFDDRVIDLLGEGVDLAVRAGVLPPPDSPFVVARRLASYERFVCATPAFLKKQGLVKSVESLASVPCVIQGGAPTRWQFETPEGPKTVAVDGRVRSNNILALREAALAGLGVVQLPRWLIVDDLKAKRLVRILDWALLPTVNVLGLVHAEARRSNSLRLVQDFLAMELPRALGQAGAPPKDSTKAQGISPARATESLSSIGASPRRTVRAPGPSARTPRPGYGLKA